MNGDSGLEAAREPLQELSIHVELERYDFTKSPILDIQAAQFFQGIAVNRDKAKESLAAKHHESVVARTIAEERLKAMSAHLDGVQRTQFWSAVLTIASSISIAVGVNLLTSQNASGWGWLVGGVLLQLASLIFPLLLTRRAPRAAAASGG